MNNYFKYLLISIGCIIGGGLFVALGNWLFDEIGAIIAFVILIGIGIWYYNYNYKKNKCPLQK